MPGVGKSERNFQQLSRKTSSHKVLISRRLPVNFKIFEVIQLINNNMSSSSKRLRKSSSREGCEADGYTSTGSNLDVEADPSTSRSATCGNNVNTDNGSGVFTVDLLPVILDNLGILTPKDLLNFRLVNQLFRDIATSVLLKRNACSIVLELREVEFGSGGYPNSDYEHLSVKSNENKEKAIPPIVRYYSARPPPYIIPPGLIKLISSSPNFPSNSIIFHPGCTTTAIGNLSTFAANKKDHLTDKELIRFHSHFAKRIKKISFPRRIPVSSAQNLLFVQFPNLICLDLENFEEFRSPQGLFQNAIQVFHFPPSQEVNDLNLNQISKLEKIYLGAQRVSYNKIQLIDKIVDISPSLRAITDANMIVLWMLNNKRKAQLIKSLHYDPPHISLSTFSDEPSIADNLSLLKLNEFTVNLGKLRASSTVLYDELTRNLKIIFEGSKDTLEYLELHVNPNDFRINVLIPPLRKLKCLKLVQDNTCVGSKCHTREADAIWARVPIFKFENQENPNRIPPDYFPALTKVLLDVERPLINMNNKLLEFFDFTHPHQEVNNQSNTNVATMSSVTTLELTTFPSAHNDLGKWFPNLSNLKIKYVSGCSKLSNWVWGVFPKLEKLEIDEFLLHEDIKNVDGFFTGIPQDVCTKLVENYEFVTGLEFNQETIQFLRTQPYIGDCENLKDFTIKFNQNISSGFVSTLTRYFAFQEITHRTKIVFSFEAANLFVKNIEEIRKNLDPVASCIEILP